MKIAPEIAIEEKVQNVKKVRKTEFYKQSSPLNNNRRTKRGRNTQYITCMDDSTFPPTFRVKCIKHKILG